MLDRDDRSPPRHRVYLIALPLTIFAVVITFSIERGQGNTDPFNQIVLPLLALLLSLLALGHWLRALSLRWVESSFFVVAALAYFSKFAFTLLNAYAPDARAHELSQVYIWTPFIYALAFLIGTPRASLYRAGGIYLISGGIGLTAVSLGVQLGGYRLTEYYLGNLVLLALLYLVGSLRTKIGELQTDLSETTRLATVDFLTGVPNRRQLEARLHRELEFNRLYGTPVSVILFDVDNFKAFNDTYGHAAGDEVLKTVAGTVQQELRSNDTFGRWGGEEFLVIAVHTDARQATLLAERLRQLVEAKKVNEAQRVTASFGVAAYRNNLNLESLVERADVALYKAKTLGRNRVELDSPSGLPPGVKLPRLVYPFPEVLKKPDGEVVVKVTAWLVKLNLGPASAGLRKHMARGFAHLASTLHPHAPHNWQVLLGKWYCWAFLHDDRCDTSDLGRQPERLKMLTDRLSKLFAGATARRDDEPLGWALAELRGELLEVGGAAWFKELDGELNRYFSALHWEARNRVGDITPSISRYLEMRPVTAGLRIDNLFSRADGVLIPAAVRGQEPVLALTQLANEVVCWANDLISLDKELQQGDIHNLVQVLQYVHGFNLQTAIEQAGWQHNRTLSRYLEAEQQVKQQFGNWQDLEMYLELLRARMRGIHDWALMSGRYR